MAELDADRDAKTVADLCARFVAEHLAKKRPSTVRNYRALIDGDIMPALKHKKVTEVESTDVDNLHRKVTKRAPYMANRTVAVLSKMFRSPSSGNGGPTIPCEGSSETTKRSESATFIDRNPNPRARSPPWRTSRAPT